MNNVLPYYLPVKYFFLEHDKVIFWASNPNAGTRRISSKSDAYARARFAGHNYFFRS